MITTTTSSVKLKFLRLSLFNLRLTGLCIVRWPDKGYITQNLLWNYIICNFGFKINVLCQNSCMGVFMDARFFTAVALFNQLGHITYRYSLFSKFEAHLLEMAPSFFFFSYYFRETEEACAHAYMQKSFDKIYCEHSFSRSTTCIMYMCFEKHWMLNIFGGFWASFWVSWDIREAVLNSFLDWPLLFAFCIVSYFLED